MISKHFLYHRIFETIYQDFWIGISLMEWLLIWIKPNAWQLKVNRLFLGSTEPLENVTTKILNGSVMLKFKSTKREERFKSRIPLNTPSRTKLNPYRAVVLSIRINGVAAWFPVIKDWKKWSVSRKSCFRWVFGHQQSYEVQHKNQFLPICKI